MTGRPSRSSRARLARPLAVASVPAVTPQPRPRMQLVAESGPVVGSVCTGYGGLDLGVLAALGGGRVAWVADPDPHIELILDARMPGTPNLGDLRVIDWTTVEPVEVLTAGFPCQDISAAGKRAGIEEGQRSGLWADIVAGVRVLRPALVVVENVAALRWKGGGLHRVLGDLAEAGYDACWRSVRAADIGAAHRRERVFLLAWPRAPRTDRRARRCGGDAGDTDRARRLVQRHQRHQQTGWPVAAGPTAAAADTDSLGREELHTPHPDRWTVTARPSPTSPSPAPADTDSGRLPFRRDPDSARPGSADPDRVSDAHRLGAPAAHTSSNRHRDSGTPSGQGFPATAVAAGASAGEPAAPAAHTADHAAANTIAAHTPSHGRDEGLPGTAGLQGRPDAALSGHPPTHPAPEHEHRGNRGRRHLVAVPDPGSESVDPSGVRSPSASVNWGAYEVAIGRWEALLGRSAPHPTQLGNHGRPVLAPAFVEWLMGLEPGWVTGLPLPRTAQLRALGNGVVPQQAAHAVALLLADLHHLTHRCEGGRTGAVAA